MGEDLSWGVLLDAPLDMINDARHIITIMTIVI